MQDQSAHPTTAWLEQEEPYRSSSLPAALHRLEETPNIEAALVAVGIALDEARTNVPEKLFKLINKDPGKTAFRTVLAQLGDARLIRLMEWLSTPDHPTRHELLAGLLTPGTTDSSQAIAVIYRALTRRTILQRMIGDERIGSLYAVCRPPLPQEAGITP